MDKQQEPEYYYDKEIRDVHHCRKCDEVIPLSRKKRGLCSECDTPPKIFKKKRGFFK